VSFEYVKSFLNWFLWTIYKSHLSVYVSLSLYGSLYISLIRMYTDV